MQHFHDQNGHLTCSLTHSVFSHFQSVNFADFKSKAFPEYANEANKRDEFDSFILVFWCKSHLLPDNFCWNGFSRYVHLSSGLVPCGTGLAGGEMTLLLVDSVSFSSYWLWSFPVALWYNSIFREWWNCRKLDVLLNVLANVILPWTLRQSPLAGALKRT